MIVGINNMKITIFKNRRAIHITPKPTKYIAGGLKVYYSRDIDEEKAYDLPIATTDIVIGKNRYYLPKKMGFNIYRAEIKSDGILLCYTIV